MSAREHASSDGNHVAPQIDRPPKWFVENGAWDRAQQAADSERRDTAAHDRR